MSEFPFPQLGHPRWRHAAALGQPQLGGWLGARCSLQKGNLQLSPVKARTQGFSVGFLSLLLSLSLFSFSGNETNSDSSLSCHSVSMDGSNSLSSSLPSQLPWGLFSVGQLSPSLPHFHATKEGAFCSLLPAAGISASQV